MTNKKNKVKTGIILCVAVVVIGGVLLYVIKNNTLLMATDIEVFKWNEKSTDVVICGNVKDVRVDDIDLSTTFRSKSEREDMAATNPRDYLGEIVYYDDNLSFPASLFYTDNNYYVLYLNDTVPEPYYILRNCNLDYDLTNEMIVVPSPVYMYISDIAFEWCREHGISELDVLFDNYTFEEAKEFYARLSEEYVVIDEEKEQITVDAYNIREDISYDKFITIDFKNRTITGKDENGDTITVDGKWEKKQE